MINFATSRCFPTHPDSSRYPCSEECSEAGTCRLTVGPEHNSAGRQGQSSASSTLSPQNVTQQQKTRMKLRVFQVSLGPRTTATNRPVLLISKRNKSYEQGRRWGWASVAPTPSGGRVKGSRRMVVVINILDENY